MPMGLNTQRIKEVRKNLRPSLASFVPDCGPPPVGGDNDNRPKSVDEPSMLPVGDRMRLFETGSGSRVMVVSGQRKSMSHAHTPDSPVRFRNHMPLSADSQTSLPTSPSLRDNSSTTTSTTTATKQSGGASSKANVRKSQLPLSLCFIVSYCLQLM